MNKEVNEERAFRLASGHRALDFLATLRDRHREPVECLRTPADLDRWLTIAALDGGDRATSHDLAEAQKLRETINRLVRAVLATGSPAAADMRKLNAWALRPSLAPQAGGGLELHWTGPVEAALALVAREAVELLTDSERSLIRECEAAPSCSRLYLDRSPGRRRRWCHMDWCGSSSKMANYRSRLRARPA
jgi:predicted RNA-binding Zn ribbon-like protein